MRCPCCDRMIPDGSSICQYCGEPLVIDPNRKIKQVSFTEISRKRFLDKIFGAVSPLIGVLIIFALLLGAFGVVALIDYIQGSVPPVKFSQDVLKGNPVWCVIVSMEEPRYAVVKTYNRYSSGFVTPSDNSDVLCECIDCDGNVVWLLLKYKEYLDCFSGRNISEGLRIIGRVKDSDDLVDYYKGDIKGQKVIDFKSVDE